MLYVVIYCKTRIFSVQFVLALLTHSLICAKISSALNSYYFLIKNRECAKISLRKKVSSPLSAKI